MPKRMPKDVLFRDEVCGHIHGILRAMLESNRSDDYKEAATTFAACLSDSFGIGVVDEHGDLVDIGRFGGRIGGSPVIEDALLRV